MDQVLSDTLRANLRAAKTAEAKIDALGDDTYQFRDATEM